jgi:hypothetical protein
MAGTQLIENIYKEYSFLKLLWVKISVIHLYSTFKTACPISDITAYRVWRLNVQLTHPK